MIKRFNKFCLNAWNGKAPLLTVFWGLWFPGQIFIWLLNYILFYLVIFLLGEDAVRSLENLSGPAVIPYIIMGAVQIGIEIFLIRCVWKCSWNVKNRVWGYLARIAIALVVLQYLLMVF